MTNNVATSAGLLNALGLDLTDEGLVESHRKMAQGLIEMTNDPEFDLTTFPDKDCDDLVLVQEGAR